MAALDTDTLCRTSISVCQLRLVQISEVKELLVGQQPLVTNAGPVSRLPPASSQQADWQWQPADWTGHCGLVLLTHAPQSSESRRLPMLTRSLTWLLTGLGTAVFCRERELRVRAATLP
jgi:hypothetical protein